jgi:DUF971 family protein
MRPLDLQLIGNQLAVKWPDGSEGFITLEMLRRACPCAECKGEMDILGTLHKVPEKAPGRNSFELTRIAPVGGYAIQPVWGYGHASGLFSFEYLRELTV